MYAFFRMLIVVSSVSSVYNYYLYARVISWLIYVPHPQRRPSGEMRGVDVERVGHSMKSIVGERLGHMIKMEGYDDTLHKMKKRIRQYLNMYYLSVREYATRRHYSISSCLRQKDGFIHRLWPS